ncbi:germination protein YpeB [Geosporobacter ferrireducens]|uniref:Germination protein YpeB n=1 Tax=Geosporobacter ferrireducens TaxID=1424294 RepID=A0A1D8GGY9_9FIRM|nr:germination protein YpeB [Geosporobacter ferrireducens]AOT70174.1 germination protein YpeB [Geosporobacter ferrireducens]MTI53280.1 germination protein YpeB [Geosporobacter ferrireducens]
MKYILPILLAIALIVAGVWGYNQQQAREEYATFFMNNNQRLYYDLTGSVQSITTDLSKLMVSGQTRQNIILYSNIWKNSYNAQEKLAQLPIQHAQVSKTEKFLNQVGDYTFALAKRNLDGEQLSEQELENLESLHNYSASLCLELQELHNSIFKGEVWTGELIRKANKKLNRKAEEENPIDVQFNKFEERMVEYPELIYDGPFSEHVVKGKKPRLEGDKITEEQAREKVKEFLGEGTIKTAASAPGSTGRIDTYSFEAIPKNQAEGKGNTIYIDISQRVGYPVYILNNRDVPKANISPKQAIKRADKFLEEKGFKNMMPTYTMRYDNVVLVNYVYKQNDIVIYPDLIKVKIALDNGEVVGFDATQFLTSNYQRDIETPKLTSAEARKKATIRAQIEEEGQLCIIPTDAFGEILCYEFEANYKQDKFLVYVNANTGVEEKILKTVEKENGTLMI